MEFGQVTHLLINISFQKNHTPERMYDVYRLIFDGQRMKSDLTEENRDDKFTQLCQCSGGIDNSDDL